MFGHNVHKIQRRTQKKKNSSTHKHILYLFTQMTEKKTQRMKRAETQGKKVYEIAIQRSFTSSAVCASLANLMLCGFFLCLSFSTFDFPVQISHYSMLHDLPIQLAFDFFSSSFTIRYNVAAQFFKSLSLSHGARSIKDFHIAFKKRLCSFAVFFLLSSHCFYLFDY